MSEDAETWRRAYIYHLESEKQTMVQIQATLISVIICIFIFLDIIFFSIKYYNQWIKE